MAVETVDDALPGKHQKEMMSDEPITSKGQDRLGMDLHARALAAVVRNAPTPFTIALQGEWGSGKTSLMRLMYNELCEEGGDGKVFYGIEVNAWKCALAASTPDEAALMVGEAIRDKVREKAKRVDGHKRARAKAKRSFYDWAMDAFDVCAETTERFENKIREFGGRIEILAKKRHDGWKSKTKAVCKLLCNAFCANFWRVMLFVLSMFIFLFHIVNVIWGVIVERKLPQLEIITGTERVEALTLKALFGRRHEGVDDFRMQMENCINTIKRCERNGVVIFVDDLDRMEPQQAVKVLDALKNLFVINDCVFVLAIAYDVVERGLRNKFCEQHGGQTESNNDDGRAYFDKIIQLPFHMPVERYPIDKLIEDGLTGFWAFEKERFSDFIGLREGNVVRDAMGEHHSRRVTRLDWFKCVVQNSTGWNPRSVKRLKYLLSLVGAIYEENKKSADKNSERPDILSLEERYLCFVLVCLQIAYQHIYKKLLLQPEFTRWRAAKKDAESAKQCDKEEWNCAVRQAVSETTLKGREKEIITLLQLMECCAPSNKLRDTMKKLLDLLVLATGDGAAPPQPMDREGFFKYLGEKIKEDKSSRPEKIKTLWMLLEKMEMMFTENHGANPLEYMYDKAGVRVFLGSSCLVEWEVGERPVALPYSFWDGEKRPELEYPTEVLMPKAKFWVDLCKAYNREVSDGKELPDDFVENCREELWSPVAGRGTAS